MIYSVTVFLQTVRCYDFRHDTSNALEVLGAVIKPSAREQFGCGQLAPRSPQPMRRGCVRPGYEQEAGPRPRRHAPASANIGKFFS